MQDTYVAGWDEVGGGMLCEIYPLGSGRYREERGIRKKFGILNSAETVIRSGVWSFMEELTGKNACRCSCICISSQAGAREQSYREMLKELGFEGRVLVSDRREAAFRGALGESEGVFLFAGEECFAKGRTSGGKQTRVGGYGCFADDAGSEEAVGREILKAVLRAEDGRGEETLLRDAVFSEWKVKNTGEMVHRAQAPEGRKDTAELFSLLVPAVLSKDTEAVRIAEQEARELVRMASTAFENLTLERGVLVPGGSVLDLCLPIRDRVFRLMREQMPQVEISDPMYDAASGAVMMAREQAENREKKEAAK